MAWAGTPQRLDAGPRGGAQEVMSALSTGGKKKICFFKGDDEGTAIGSHSVFDFAGEEQSVGMVQTWNQCSEMILTSMDKRDAMLIMDTERGATKSELNLRRQQKNWNMTVDSITPMQKFAQYQASKEYQLFGLGDAGKTVFALTHDSRAGENVEEFVIRADSHRKYKSYTFTCHSQTKAGFLALGRTDGAIALYDFIMKDEKASCVIDGMPGPVTSTAARLRRGEEAERAARCRCSSAGLRDPGGPQGPRRGLGLRRAWPLGGAAAQKACGLLGRGSRVLAGCGATP